MTDDTTHTNEAARIAAALDNWDNTYGPNPDRVVRHFDGFTLTVAGLRTVLAALDNAQKHATRLDKFADDIATEQAELGADVQRLEAERDELQARVAELEAERARVTTVLGQIEQKALAEETNGYAIAYCALWDAHGLLLDALNGGNDADPDNADTADSHTNDTDGGH